MNLVENAISTNSNKAFDTNQDGVDIHALDENGHSALYHAVRYGLAAEAFELMNLGADIDFHDLRGMSLLHIAIILEHLDIASELLGRGAKTDTVSISGASPLYEAAYRDDPCVALKLIAYGANIVDETKITGIRIELENRSSSKLNKLSALSMRQGAAQGGHTNRLKELLNDYPSSARADQPQALLKLALKHKRDDCAAFLQSHIASLAINDLLSNNKQPKAAALIMVNKI